MIFQVRFNRDDNDVLTLGDVSADEDASRALGERGW